jgi:Xaa-Pro aminopeptidase
VQASLEIPGDFGPSDFRRRREAVLSGLGTDVMVIPAAAPAGGSGDSRYVFRPGGDLFYLTGCVEPGAVLLLHGGEADHAVTLFVPPRDPEAERWSGPRLGPEGTSDLLGIDHVLAASELPGRLSSALRSASKVHFRLGSDPVIDGVVGEALAFGRREGTRKGVGPRAVVDPGVILEPLRVRKDAGEMEALRRASALTNSAFAEALPHATPGAREWEVQARLEQVFRASGALPAFGTIVATGANACVLHHVANRGVIRPGDLVLVDGGAELDLYAGDVSRTVPASGRFTDPQRAAYEVVVSARSAALAAALPGRPVSDIHDAAVAELTAGLVGLGALEGSAEDLIAEEAYKAYYPHNTSHWIGLEVHDPGVYAVDGIPLTLEAGMVLTVEPGLYFPPDLPGVPEDLAGMGIRLEDDVAIGPDGPRVLGGSLALEPDDVEYLMAHGR